MTQSGPCIPTSVPDHTRILSTHLRHLKVRWMSRRWNPTECPVHIVIASSTTKDANAPQEKNIGPATTATTIIPAFQIDRAGSHLTLPASGFTSLARISELTR